mgnify:CR=1 FL=1
MVSTCLTHVVESSFGTGEKSVDRSLLEPYEYLCTMYREKSVDRSLLEPYEYLLCTYINRWWLVCKEEEEEEEEGVCVCVKSKKEWVCKGRGGLGLKESLWFLYINTPHLLVAISASASASASLRFFVACARYICRADWLIDTPLSVFLRLRSNHGVSSLLTSTYSFFRFCPVLPLSLCLSLFRKCKRLCSSDLVSFSFEGLFFLFILMFLLCSRSTFITQEATPLFPLFSIFPSYSKFSICSVHIKFGSFSFWFLRLLFLLRHHHHRLLVPLLLRISATSQLISLTQRSACLQNVVQG